MQKDLLRWNSVRRKAETLWDPKMGYVISLFVVVEAVVMPLRAVYYHLLFPFGYNEGVIALKKAKRGHQVAQFAGTYEKWHKKPAHLCRQYKPSSKDVKDQQHKGQRAFYER